MPLQDAALRQLDALLQEGALVLVPNHRSSGQLGELVARWRADTGNRMVQPKPAIMAIDLWLTDLWRQLSLHRDDDRLQWHVLQGGEELLLWRKVLQDSSPDLLLLNQDGAAASASEALRLLQQWQIPAATLRQHVQSAAGELPDDRALAMQWLQAFERLCKKQRLLTFSGMLQVLLELLGQSAPVTLPPTLLLFGFDEPPPLYRALLDCISSSGCQVRNWDEQHTSPLLQLSTHTLVAEECRAAARWAAAVLATQPHARIGIISADNKVLGSTALRCLHQEFGPHSGKVASATNHTLADEPFIATALAVLELSDTSIDTLRCCSLLRSPWLPGAPGEQDARAELELRLRKRVELQVRSADLRTWCLQEDRQWYCPLLGAALRDVETLSRRQPATQTVAAWLQYFQCVWNLLLDTPALVQSGRRPLRLAWETLQKTLQLAGFLFGTVDLQEARTLLRGLCRTQSLTQDVHQAPVLLLSPTAAAGLNFSHVWLLQMTEEYWPGEERPHPYLPHSLQKAHHMPGCDPLAALARSRALLAGICRRTAQQLVFSHAASHDELPQRPSALLPVNLVPHAAVVTASGALHPALYKFRPAELDIHADTRFLPLPAVPPHTGSTTVLAQQAECPFRAFAHQRLQVRELPQPVWGLPASAIGTCVHGALQHFWNHMQDSAQLAASSTADLHAAMREATDAALRKLAQQFPHTLTPALRDLEQQRLTDLLLDWLPHELQRGPFQVLATEADATCRYGPLQLNLRIDRIDRNADGSTSVVDYKTGKVGNPAWEDPRPDAPQLLLYQQALDSGTQYGPVAALFHARINPEESRYAGISADDSILPGSVFSANRTVTATEWAALKAHWQKVLQDLAQEFIDGYAAVQPQDPATCDHCQLAGFCRINELRQAG